MSNESIKSALETAAIVAPILSFCASVIVAGMRAAYPEPLETLPRWLRFVEGCLDRIAMNSERRKT